MQNIIKTAWNWKPSKRVSDIVDKTLAAIMIIVVVFLILIQYVPCDWVRGLFGC